MTRLNDFDADCEGGLLAGQTLADWLDQIEATWRHGVARLTFCTSGSTGRPKRCVHSFEHLGFEIDFLTRLWRDRSRIVAIVPAHHIYGLLFTALLPDALDVTLVDATHMGPRELSNELRPGDLVVTFPERWDWLVRSIDGWPADVRGVVSTGPCPASLIENLMVAGLAGMTEVYGSTETAGIATREWPETSYRLMPHWHFGPATDEGMPSLNHLSGHRFALMDTIRRYGDDRFTLAGRNDGQVQVGGVNVSPALVAARLKARPFVKDAAVRLMRQDEGQRLKAFVVLEAGCDPIAVERDLAVWMRANLSAAERAMSLSFGASLPTNVMGKPLDW